MFVSQEKNVGKKTFQKPNILRKKPKGSSSRANISKPNESHESNTDVAGTQYVNKKIIPNQHFESPRPKGSSTPLVTNSVLKLTIANNNVEKRETVKQETDIDANVMNNASISSNVVGITYEDKSLEQTPLNIESFINSDTSDQSLPLSNIDVTLSSEKKTMQAKKWYLDLTNNAMDITINNYNIQPLAVPGTESEYIVDVVPSEIPTTVVQPSKQLHEIICSSAPNRTVSVEIFSNKAVKFKCDEPNCSKGFWSEERLKKHKKSHNRQPTGRIATQTILECPVKKILDDGSEDKCPQIFQARRELLKHLNTDHTLEDALHRCEVCGRRFFWASGLRAHAQSVCARGGLACAWPGCGRVFRLPCRLREHARAHTGDRPYRCKFPECGWAFRSASKLVRHARRHTGERRHACGACGRAFLRREHLRHHAATHLAPAAPCHHQGCDQTFTNMSTLYMHMKKVHRKDKTEGAARVPTQHTPTTMESGENLYLVSVIGGAEVEGELTEEGESAGEAGGAARTHCTWPLAPRHVPADPAYVLEEDVHVESAECSASNGYTVRSDLFLHSNIPIDEDSQNIGGAVIAEGGEVVAPLDTDLCLIDSDPTIDLMQEELYDDVAVDESPFRVFLMNTEELS